jgi:hypothetical protein
MANKYSQMGNADITLGIRETINFEESFAEIPNIIITPTVPVSVKPGSISQDFFTIISSTIEGHYDVKKGKVGWIAYGKDDLVSIPLWKGILNNSIDQRLANNYRSEIVDLCTSTELFLNHYLSEKLKQIGWNENIIEQILDLRFERKIDIGYTAIKGDKFQNLYMKLYNDYRDILRKNRNDVVHKGLDKTEDDAIICRLTTFDFISKIEPENIKYFSDSKYRKIRAKFFRPTAT